MFRARPFSITGTSRFLLVSFVITALLVLPGMAMAKIVVIETPLGDIEIELLEEDAPKTVANFLNYIESGRYDKTFIHRSVHGFIIQGGGFAFIDGAAPGIDTFPTVVNEFKVSNTRGTVAMAKIGGQPDSATSQWFINTKDNSASLDVDNGGYTVFVSFENAAGLDKDASVRVAGVEVGKITDITLKESRAWLTLKIKPDIEIGSDFTESLFSKPITSSNCSKSAVILCFLAPVGQEKI